MNNIEKEFVPYELAIKLKALGFDEPCLFAFDNCSTPMRCSDLRTNEQKFNGVNYNSSSYTSQPTFSQAFRWFREKHQIITEIIFYNNGEEWEDTEYKVTVNRFEDFATHNTFVKSDIKTYEDAESICLDKLIQIVELGKKWDELYNSGLDEPLKEW